MTSLAHQRDQAALLAPSTPAQVAILLSERLANFGFGLDLTTLLDWLQDALPPLRAHVVPNLAGRPGEIARLATEAGAERLVLGLATGELDIGEIQTQARKAGLDPLGVVILNLGAQAALLGPQPTTTERAKLLLSAAVAKARAFTECGPEHLKVSLSVAVSRRSLFTLAMNEYHAVPAVLPERCVADRGCRRCVDMCPHDALQLKDHRVEVDKAHCTGCGLCLSACPADAITFPSNSVAELDAQIAALLDPTNGELVPRGILFVCRASIPALEAAIERGVRYDAGWLPVVVPCVGSLSPTVFLRCLAAGAAGVGLVTCEDRCPSQQHGIAAERVAFCRELLQRIGAPSNLVRFCPVDGDDSMAWALAPATAETSGFHLADTVSRYPSVAAEALLQLARTYGAPPDLTLAHEQSPFGVVELDAQACTGCEACTAACPTGALAVDRAGDAISIGFDAANCSACGICVPRCPEVERGVLRLQPAVDLRRLATGRTVVYQDRAPRCVACGAPIAPAGMMTRLAEMLGEQYVALAPTIARYCADCRGGPTSTERIVS
jgi:ferredoxin